MMAKANKIKHHLTWTGGGKRAKKIEEDRLNEERARRVQDAAREAFPKVDNANKPSTPGPSNQPWYGPPSESTPSNKPGSDEANLSEHPEDEANQQSPTSSDIRLREHQRHETGSATLTDNQAKAGEPSNSNHGSIMNRPRPGKELAVVGIDENAALRWKITEGNLPAKPDSLDTKTNEHLRSIYNTAGGTATNRKLLKQNSIERRPVGAASKQEQGCLNESSSILESAVDSTAPSPGRFSSSIPAGYCTPEKSKPKFGRNNEDLNVEVANLSNQIHGYESGKGSEASSSTTTKSDEERSTEENGKEESSINENSLTNKIMDLEEQLEKKTQRVMELEFEKERNIGQLQGIKETMKSLHEEQLHSEQTAHAATKKEYGKKVEELLALHSAEETEMQEDLFAQKQKFGKELEKINTKLSLAKLATESKVREIEELQRTQESAIQRATGPLHKKIETMKGESKKFKEEKAGEIQKMKKAHDEALKTEKNNFQKRVGLVKEELETLKRDKTNQIQRMSREHENALKNERTNSQNRVNAVKDELEGVIRDKISEIQNLNRGHERALNICKYNFQQQMDALNEELEKLKGDKIKEIQKLSLEHEKALRHEQDNSKKALEAITLQLAQFKASHQMEIQSLADQNKTEIRRAGESLRLQVQNLQSNLGELALTKKREIEAIKEAHKAEKAKINQDNEINNANQVRQLIQDNEALKGLLFERDSFKAMTDNDLEDGFGPIRQEVDEIARVEWNKRLESTWPFPERSFHQSKIKRVAKQHLIQNTLWVILYDRIFCTPFRVLGNEGRALEEEWTRKFGQDDESDGILCPRATKTSEKWRYETALRCIEAIEEPTPSSGSVKVGFESTIKQVTNELFQQLERVATTSEIEDQGLEKRRVNELVRNAATFWLKAGEQRFRTKVIVSESGEKPVLSRETALSPSGTLNLVVFPELRRLGNAQGERLEHEELVIGCAGSFVLFRT